MRFRLVPCEVELHTGSGAGGEIWRGTVDACAEALLSQYAGKVQTIYLDPPFGTGKRFSLRQRYGDAGWETGSPALTLPAYADFALGDEALHALLDRAVRLAHALLREDGSLFLHIDPRLHAPMRLLLNEVFGEGGFVNEIIWAYRTGGRATTHFSRKHDVILFYRKSPGAYFNLSAVGVPRAGSRRNHLRRSVDERGRAYRSIRSGGREYRYYDDEPAYPGDVWDDVAHMQQKDPQRTGYDNQKPVRLLERVILCSSRPGDLVCDLFAGSGTTAVAAAKHHRRFLSVDAGEAALCVQRKRLLGRAMTIQGAMRGGSPEMRAIYRPGLGYAEIGVSSYRIEEGLCAIPSEGVQALDQISAGYLREGAFHAFAHAARTKLTPVLPDFLEIPMLEGTPALLTVDALGRRFLHALEDEHVE